MSPQCDTLFLIIIVALLYHFRGVFSRPGLIRAKDYLALNWEGLLGTCRGRVSPKAALVFLRTLTWTTFALIIIIGFWRWGYVAHLDSPMPNVSCFVARSILSAMMIGCGISLFLQWREGHRYILDRHYQKGMDRLLDGLDR